MAKPDALTEALLGLCVLAAKGHNHPEIQRLVEQFRKTYPEIIALSSISLVRHGGESDPMARAVVSIEVDKQTYDVISEHLDSSFSHTIHAGGIQQMLEFARTNPLPPADEVAP